MKTFTRTVALVAALGVLAPMTASAAGFFNTHDELVQKINKAYGTQFKTHTHMQSNGIATSQAAKARHDG